MKLTLKQRLARAAYSCFCYALEPFYLVKLWMRARKEPAYGQHIAERFGFYKQAVVVQQASTYVWVHAVSLGETRAAAVLVSELRKAIPEMKLLLTHGTATGRSQGQALLQEGDIQCWIPIDTPTSVKRFMHYFRPAVGVLIETEIWPNLMHEARRSQVPVVLANARLSERSLNRMRKVQALLEPAYQALAAALAQSEDDAKRLKQAGVDTVKVVGNLKYDMQPDVAQLHMGWQRKKVLTLKNPTQNTDEHKAFTRPVIMAASTREGEEVLLLQAWKSASWMKLPVEQQPVLLLVPRHPQRFEDVAQLIKSEGLDYSLRSSWEDIQEQSSPQSQLQIQPQALIQNTIRLWQEDQVWLGDSVGEMPFYYGLADMVLLGGSFKRFGGQNLLEALACHCPVIMGEHTYNFAQASQMAEQAHVAVRVSGFEQALLQAKQWLDHVAQLEQLKMSAGQFIAQHQGGAQQAALYITKVRFDSASVH